jgi:hypothetical protein
MSNQQNSLFLDDEFEEMKITPEKVTCLGMEFPSDEARKEYFREELRKKLPELKKIEGFPIGEDDDIINLSDPPYYTTCPNPWLNDFVEEWEQEKKLLIEGGQRHADFEVKEPYATSINEGKNHPIYNAHSYHTKVPHYVIMNYYLHYTQPGDIVIDSFAGTGMAGVAANYCYSPDPDAKGYFNSKWKKEYGYEPNWGIRHCILGDLSPICSFITYNYTNTIEANRFKKAAEKILVQLEKELGHLYVQEIDNQVSTINYTIWSEIQVCPSCNKEFVFWDAAVDFKNQIQKEQYSCPHCGAIIAKRTSTKAMETVLDTVLNEPVQMCKFIPVVINYTNASGRNEKELSNEEREALLKKHESLSIKGAPISKLQDGDKTSDPFRLGITHLHQFYSHRNLYILIRFKELIDAYKCDARLKSFLRIWFTSCQSRLHMMNRYAVKHHRHVGPMANTLYISATPTEISPFYFINSKIKDNSFDIQTGSVVNQIVSATNSILKDNSIDYIFTDPPFGANIMYSELNFIWESWLGLRTNNEEEAICNKTQRKSVFEYQEIMTRCFKEYYRLLKPGKWITVEFSNTSAAVWNSIQYSLQSAGFIVSSVSDLSKGRGGLHGIVNVVSVNQDLAITCFKPSEKLIQTITNSSDDVNSVWDFVTDLLLHQPVHMIKDSQTTAIIERSPKILYDRLISYYVQLGYSIPIDAKDFQTGLCERFIERDDMFFTASQALEYEDKKSKTDGIVPMALFVSSEAEGIEWLKRELNNPQTYAELQPEWMKAMTTTKKGDILPELMDILKENFIEDEDGKWRNPDAEKAADLEIIRNRKLMKEFNLYLEQAQKPKAKRMKDTRLEVLRYGFKECYKKKDYQSIVIVGDHIQESLLQEDEVLLQYYDIASSRV